MDAKMIAVQVAYERLIAAERNLQSQFAAAVPLGSRLQVQQSEGRFTAEYIVATHSYEPGYLGVKRVQQWRDEERVGAEMKVYMLQDYLRGNIKVKV